MKIMVNLTVAIFLLLSFQNCHNGEAEIDRTTEFEEYIQEEMDSQKIPAMSILIFEEEDVLFEKYLGKAQIQQNIPLEHNQLFLLASISKVITATALLQLQEEGHFSLDDRINDYLPFSITSPNSSTDITFRMLLTHTSGIADGSALDDQYYYGEDSPVELRYFLENYLVPNGSFYNSAENFYDYAAGSEHEYSNTGTALIGLLVEQISGIDFNTYCKLHIFNPLGMNDTYWRIDEISQTIVQPYNYENGQYEAIPHYTFTDYPNGGLRSTGSDFFKFLSAFTTNGVSGNYELLASNTVNSMITPQIPSLDNEMGLHLFLMNVEHGLWGHDGGEQGAGTIAAFNPTRKIGAIILTNQGEAELDEILVEAYKFGANL